MNKIHTNDGIEKMRRAKLSERKVLRNKGKTVWDKVSMCERTLPMQSTLMHMSPFPDIRERAPAGMRTALVRVGRPLPEAAGNCE